MCEPKVCSAHRKLILGFIFGSASSNGEATGDFQEDFGGDPVALESQIDKVVLARKNIFCTLACFARQCGAGLIINKGAAEVFYTRGSRKRRVNGKWTEEKEDYLYFDSRRRVSSPLSLSPSPSAFYKQNTRFSGFLTTPCEGEIDGFVIAWSSELETILEKTKSTLWSSTISKMMT